VIPDYSSLAQEWEDNKKSLLEFAWAAHMGIKGMVGWGSLGISANLWTFRRKKGKRDKKEAR
jgi:hypothetical protein